MGYYITFGLSLGLQDHIVMSGSIGDAIDTIAYGPQIKEGPTCKKKNIYIYIYTQYIYLYILIKKI